MSMESSRLAERIQQVKSSTERYNPYRGRDAGHVACRRTRRRAHTRRPTFEPCEVLSTTHSVNAIIKNISHGGAMIAGNELHEISGPLIRLSSYISGGRCAQIVWRDTDCFGVQFV